MRLLHTQTLKLSDHLSNDIPPYAILSHTWGNEEVLFEDMVGGGAEGRLGYDKIRQSCKIAAAQGLDYIWIDTCCIDKRSSAELSEAINSMYAWYGEARTCYAYLADVPDYVDSTHRKKVLEKSRWFKRGWTLQELIAPSDMMFYSTGWAEIGTKYCLSDDLAKITGIHGSVLTGCSELQSRSIAERMSWASQRATTRIEDIAYCLMGIFDVNMPLLYGEGEKAFIRLQEEIIKHSDDTSLFAWTDPKASSDSQHGLLARSPAYFIHSGNVKPYADWELNNPYSISNKGLRIELHLSPSDKDLYVAALRCPVPPDYEGYLGIYLQRLPTGNRQYVRVKPQALCKISVRGTLETVYVRNSVNLGLQVLYPRHAFQIRDGPSEAEGYKLINNFNLGKGPKGSQTSPVLTSRKWPTSRRSPLVFNISKGSRELAGTLLIEDAHGWRFAILLGSTSDLGIGFEAIHGPDLEDLEHLVSMFSPQAPGANMGLGFCQVRVNATPQVYSEVKYYMVDIVVESYHRAMDPITLIKDLIPGHQSPPELENPDSPSKLDVIGKIRMPWRKSRLGSKVDG